jgi:DNA-binding LacI/PurR family transcriptional regulator
MGRLSLHVLLEQIEGGVAAAPRTTVAPALIVRASTGPAPS